MEAAEVIGGDGGHAAVKEARIDGEGIGPRGAVIGGALVIDEAPGAGNLMIEQMQAAVRHPRHAPA